MAHSRGSLTVHRTRYVQHRRALLYSLERAVSMALIGIKESGEPGMSETVYAERLSEILTETLGL
jgi:hypothetical protein